MVFMFFFSSLEQCSINLSIYQRGCCGFYFFTKVPYTRTAITSTYLHMALQFTKLFCTQVCHSLLSPFLIFSLWVKVPELPDSTKCILAFPSESAGSGIRLEVCLGLFLGREWSGVMDPSPRSCAVQFSKTSK